MSSDNMIIVRETENGEYDVKETWSHGGDITIIGHYKSLREAMIASEKFQKENEVEYATTFVPYTRNSDMI